MVKIAKQGVRDYLIKPFKAELLVERVSRVVEISAKAKTVGKQKRFDDPISILVVDDKRGDCRDSVRGRVGRDPRGR